MGSSSRADGQASPAHREGAQANSLVATRPQPRCGAPPGKACRNSASSSLGFGRETCNGLDCEGFERSPCRFNKAIPQSGGRELEGCVQRTVPAVARQQVRDWMRSGPVKCEEGTARSASVATLAESRGRI